MWPHHRVAERRGVFSGGSQTSTSSKESIEFSRFDRKVGKTFMEEEVVPKIDAGVAQEGGNLADLTFAETPKKGSEEKYTKDGLKPLPHTALQRFFRWVRIEEPQKVEEYDANPNNGDAESESPDEQKRETHGNLQNVDDNDHSEASLLEKRETDLLQSYSKSVDELETLLDAENSESETTAAASVSTSESKQQCRAKFRDFYGAYRKDGVLGSEKESDTRTHRYREEYPEHDEDGAESVVEFDTYESSFWQTIWDKIVHMLMTYSRLFCFFAGKVAC
jgi:hypothetical protein